ncbi:sperm associated antigen 8 isoform X2 [Melanotaenia boesemani]|nr:sperm associated antigen 8 isoform X2 [Melanotaenia boesemani]
METLTMTRAAHVAPKSPGVRLCGIRRERLEKQIYQMISERVHAERNQPTPKPDYVTTTQRDFCVQGFIPHRPETTETHDYKNDQAITFWSENYQRVQGVTAVRNVKTPFRKSAQFSTPISERLDEIELPPDN